MAQLKLGDWGVVQEAIIRNKYPRINWKVLLGMSLTRAVARFKAAGLSAEQTYKTLVFEHPELSPEARRRLFIGVYARFGEMNSAARELNKVNR